MLHTRLSYPAFHPLYAQYNSPLFSALSAACLKSLHRFNPQDLANTAWSFGAVAHRDRTLFGGIVRVAPRLFPRMGPQEVSQLAWAMATLNFTSERLCTLISNMVVEQLGAQTASAVAVNEGGSPASGSGSVAAWNIQTTSKLAWAFSVMRPNDSQLFKAVFSHADRVIKAPTPSENDDVRYRRQVRALGTVRRFSPAAADFV